ncbi:hypothetical protein, partial [Photobacterium leiognathi]|uniref:hypothetical protein n=1 Tax=Photobacterium leiognathi TaxID=553611 RepID=UPI002981AB39
MFKGKSIRSLTKIMRVAGDATKVRLTVDLKNISKEVLVQLGFNEKINIGDYSRFQIISATLMERRRRGSQLLKVV